MLIISSGEVKVGNLVPTAVRVTGNTFTCRGEWYLVYDNGHNERPVIDFCGSNVPNLKAELLDNTMCAGNKWSFTSFPLHLTVERLILRTTWVANFADSCFRGSCFKFCHFVKIFFSYFRPKTWLYLHLRQDCFHSYPPVFISHWSSNC